MLKKTVLSLIVVSLSISCVPLVNGVSNLSTVESNEKAFSIKSTTNPNEIKKSIFLKERFLRDKGFPLSEVRTFNLTQSDLKRRFILNIFNGSVSTDRVSSAVVKINGKDYAVQSNFNQNVSDMSFSLDNLKLGLNTLEVKLSSKPNSSIDINIDGFLESYKIQGAIHSLIPRDEEIKKLQYKKGLFGIKFLEGTKVRLITDSNNNQRFVDLNGTSLEGLNRLLKTLNVKGISKSTNKPDNELDQDEISVEASRQIDTPNLNLFFRLVIDDNSDIWKITDQIRSLPYVEESYPYFVEQQPTTTIPTDPQIIGIFNQQDSIIDPATGLPYPYLVYRNNISSSVVTHASGTPKQKSDWLRFMHVLPNNIDAGAWTRTQGDPSIKSAVIGGGMQNSLLGFGQQTHEDLGNIFAINNIDRSGAVNPDINLSHETQALGVIGSTANNGKGAAGISHEGTNYLIQAYQQYKSGLKDSKGNYIYYDGGYSACLGNGKFLWFGCEPTVDSMYLAKKNGIKSIIIEIWQPPYTVEQANPEVRSTVISMTNSGISVIIPAGNTSDNDIRRLDSEDWLGNPISTSMPDTGSIIVGGLSLDGSRRGFGRNSELGKNLSYNYGVSRGGGSNGLETIGGHGVDVSGPSEDIWTTWFDDKSPNDLNRYKSFSGTSGASPAITGIINLMLALKPDLHPLEIRKILRETRQDSLLLATPDDNPNDPIATRPTAGMVDAWKALDKVKPFTTTGGISNTVFDEVINISNSTYYETFPSWSSDSNKIAFQRKMNDVPEYSPEDNTRIFTMNFDGSNKAQISNNATNFYGYPSWSPNGSKILFHRFINNGYFHNWNILTMDSDGSNLLPLTNHTGVGGYAAPRYSPDGSEILALQAIFSGSWNVFKMDLTDNSTTNIFGNTNIFSGNSNWSPDGTKIVFMAYLNGHSQIMKMNPDGSNKEQLTLGNYNADYPSFCDNGTKILFSSDESGKWQIYRMNIDGSSIERLLTSNYDDTMGFMSPDSSKIAFVRFDGNIRQIYLLK